MKSNLSRGFVFAGKSLVWAVGLYTCCMVAVYREEIAGTFSRATALGPVKTAVIPAQVADSSLMQRSGIAMLQNSNLRAIEVSFCGLKTLISLLSK